MEDVQENADKLSSLRPSDNFLHFTPRQEPRNKEFRTATPSIDSAEPEIASPSLNEETSIDSAELQVASPSLNKKKTSIDSAKLEDASPSWNEVGSSIDLEEFEDDSPAVQEPELTGPEPISKIIDFTIDQASLEVPNPYDYSAYTSLSSSINSLSPNALKVVNRAEMAFSHQQDYVIPERKRAIEIVKTLLEGKSNYRGI